MKTWTIRALWLALAVAAGFTTWLIIANRSPPTPTPTPVAASSAPDYVLKDAVVTRYDTLGSPRYVLDAATIVHLPVSGASALTRPTLDYYSASGTTWRISAARGRLDADGDHLMLAGQVQAHELDLSDPLHFAAPTAEIALDRRIVRSAGRVKLWQKGYETEGTGLYADLRAGVVNLLHEVSSRYAR
ncbi:MAG: LPS export ABC transporter periplasmic protein LptC [Gammaproteobacteria bacterium]